MSALQLEALGDVLVRGGWTALVIAGLSVAGWWIAWERLLLLRGAGARLALRLELAVPTGLAANARRRATQAFLCQERQRLLGPLQLLPTLASLCPLLGLLGTLLGMITTFGGLGGEDQARAMAAGVSRALLTTQIGLVAALPLLVLHGFTRSLAERTLAKVARATPPARPELAP